MPNLEKPTRNCVCPENGRVAWCPRFIHLDETIGSWEFTFEHFYDDDSKGSAAWLVAPNTVKAFIEGQREVAREEGKREMLSIIANTEGWEETREFYLKKVI